jgi:phosphatidate cytidylyltransferase
MNTDAMILKEAALAMACLFGVAGAVTLAARNTGWGRNMGVATASWVVICALFLLVPFAGPIPFSVLMSAIAILAVREFYKMSGICGFMRLATASLFIIAMAAALVFNNDILFHRLPLIAVIVMFLLHAYQFSYENIKSTVALQAVGLAYWGWLLLHWLLLQRLDGGYGLIVTLCAMILVNDNGAFFFGKLFGKNSPKFAPRISPNKTWVGFAGGVAGTMLVAWGFGFALPQLSLPQRLLLGLVVGVAVPFGGLIESAMKRDAGVKDSSNLIPDHGGVMDRFDSWAFSAPIVYVVMLFFAKHPF